MITSFLTFFIKDKSGSSVTVLWSCRRYTIIAPHIDSTTFWQCFNKELSKALQMLCETVTFFFRSATAAWCHAGGGDVFSWGGFVLVFVFVYVFSLSLSLSLNWVQHVMFPIQPVFYKISLVKIQRGILSGFRLLVPMSSVPWPVCQIKSELE